MVGKSDPGAVLLAGGCPREALPFLTKTVAIEPKNALALSNLAVCNRQLGHFNMALALCEAALQVDPGCVHALMCKGSAYEDLGRFVEAEEAYRDGVEASKGDRNLRLAHAQALMRLGRFAEAWPSWEFGRLYSSWRPVEGIVPWCGQDIAGKHVLVLKEGGYGDGICFSRWLPRLIEMGARVSFFVWDALAPLLQATYPTVQIIPESEAGLHGDPAEFDLQAPLLSLPHLYGMGTWGGIPEMPKIACAEPTPTEDFAPWETLLLSDKVNVGICWRAEENGINRKFRSVPIGELEPLKGIPGVRFYSLCPKGKHLHRADDFVVPEWITDLTGDLKDWSDTAAFIANLDAVVSVDTACLHLAASMAKPTLLLNPLRRDWKFSLPGEPCHWYSSAQIFNQTDPLSWLSAVKQVAEVLRGRC